MSKKFYNELTTSLKLRSQKTSTGATESQILIIYTGGTIGMTQSKDGYKPKLNAFAKALKKNRSFHDKPEHKLRLLSSNYTDDHFITPKSFFNKRIIYKLLELKPLIDSSNMQISNWLEIASVVEQHYYEYDGFLILHGTDTMAYTASALSFIFENLQKPVILTGSQIPYFEVRNDAAENLLQALTIAGHFNIPEVCLFFNNRLLRGNRSTKIDNSSFDSFESPNCSYLVKSGISFKVKWEIIRHPRNEGRFCVHRALDQNISILHFFPIITLETVKAATQSPVKAVIILTYGAGNVPSNRPEFIDEFKAAISRNVVILNITQCKRGGTSSLYQSGKILIDIGVVLGSDMTLEAAVTKLSYLLGKHPNDMVTIKKQLKENLRGELTADEEQISFSYNIQNILSGIGNSLGLYTQQEKLKVFQKSLVMLTHNAAYEGSVEDLKKLHSENVSMELKDHEDRTLLHIACRTGNLELVQFLLAVPVGVNPVDLSGHTPLFLAIMRDFVIISELLIVKGGEVRNKKGVLAQALCEAAFLGDLVRIKLFLQAGVSLLMVDFQGRTCAHAAVVGGQAGVVRFLKEETRFDWESEDLMGDTALGLAVRLGAQEIVEILKIGEE